MKKLLVMFFGFMYFCSTAYAGAKHDNSKAIDDPCSCSIGANTITSNMRKITLTQAKTLVLAALYPEQRRLPGFQFEISNDDSDKVFTDNDNPRFLDFSLIWDNPTDNSNLVGYYVVDIYTGDVFPNTGQNCSGIKTKNSRRCK
jgi:hypothetical protein